MKSYVAVDLHRRRSVVMRREPDGSTSWTQINNSPQNLVDAVFEAGPEPVVAIEATLGWYWAVDALEGAGAEVQLVHPFGLGWSGRRVKDDQADCEDLLDRLERGRLPLAWVSSPAVREFRELVRARHKMVKLRTNLKNQAHAVLAKAGIIPAVSDVFGVGGREWLAVLPIGDAYRRRLDTTLALIDHFDAEIVDFDRQIDRIARADPAYRALRTIPAVGPVLAAVFLAEIGDIGRFKGPDSLACWAGLTPKVRASDTRRRHGAITKQGSRLVRWAAIEAVARQREGSHFYTDYHRHLERRGRRGIARVAIARKLIRLVYYAMRDHEVRCLQPRPEEAAA